MENAQRGTVEIVRDRASFSWSKVLRKLALGGASVALALAAAELGTRAWLALYASGYSRARMEQECLTELQPMLGNVPLYKSGNEFAPLDETYVPSPFFAWDEDVSNSRMLVDLARAIRPGAGDTQHVLIVGGSVAAVFGASIGEDLHRALAEDPERSGKSVQVHNLARGAWKQPQQLTLLSYLLARGCRPDLVINIDGFNELALGLQNFEQGADELYPAAFMWAAFGSERVGDDDAVERAAATLGPKQQAMGLYRSVVTGGWHRSALVGTLVQRRLKVLRARWQSHMTAIQDHMESSRSRVAWRGGGAADNWEMALDSCVASWRDCSVSLDAVCKAHGVAYLHVLQPTMHDVGSKPLHADELTFDRTGEVWQKAVRQGYPKLRAQASALTEKGVSFHDLSMVFQTVEGPMYQDGCHINPTGNEIMLRSLVPSIANELEKAR